MITIDFETYSEAGYQLALDKGQIKVKALGGKGGLPEVGLHNYVQHPSFKVICLHWRNDTQGLWVHGDPPPRELLTRVARGESVEAQNAGFEFVVWNEYCVKVLGWPPLLLSQLYCSAAKCRRFSLPGSLGEAAKVMGGVQKDKRGEALIRKLTRPHTPTKTRPEFAWTPETAPDDFEAFYQYCGIDTAAEKDLSEKIPDLTPYERQIWLVDQAINRRGVNVDVESLDACIRLLRQTDEVLTNEFISLTGGQVLSVNENAKFRSWLELNGLAVESVDKKMVKELLSRSDINPTVKRALEIRQLLGGANNKKLYTLKSRVCRDGRLRESYIYCGADRTGRWASVGVQLQNVLAGGPDTIRCAGCGRIRAASSSACLCGSMDSGSLGEWGVDQMESALADIRTMDFKAVSSQWGDLGLLLSACIRGLFIASPGNDLVSADFSAIEAVALACLSRCQWRIDVFNTHGKIYETTASQISGIPLEEILDHKKKTGQHHPLRKKLGKIPELASGYAGWVGAWKAFGADKFFNSDDEIKQAVLKWRERSPEIVEFWGGQYYWQTGSKPWEGVPSLYGLEGAAVAALLNPGQTFQVNDISFGYHSGRDALLCRLPSGRFLNYHKARLVNSFDHFSRPCQKITFWGYNSNPLKGAVGWILQDTYGGKLCENITQATCADIQAEAMARLEQAGYPIVMHTHDEVTADRPRPDLNEMIKIMETRPSWASWWPIRAAGWVGKRYRKD